MTGARKLLDDCFLHDRDRLKHGEALALIAERASVVAGTEEVALERAVGRILAEDVRAARPVPGFTNAAVDGYAFALQSQAGAETVLKVTQRSAAGGPEPGPLGTGEAARIFTGAMMPAGADTCVMQEDVSVRGDSIVVPRGLRKGANVRMAGEDLKVGDLAAAAGRRLRPQDIAAIASTGRPAVLCRRPIRVALLSTGEELRRPGAIIARGQVYDSNHYMLRSLLAQTGTVIIDYGILRDEAAKVRAAVRKAAGEADVILSTGGASRGEADQIVAAMLALGTLHAWQLAVKPGRPLAIGQVGDTVFLGLPGNPVAVFTTFLLYCLPMIATLGGERWRPPQRYGVRAGFRIDRKKAGRREFWRGWTEENDEGPVLRKFDRDGSGLISGLTKATGFIEAAEEVTRVEEGDVMPFIPFSEFGITP
jgi:molybdopterin molybdotransferase